MGTYNLLGSVTSGLSLSLTTGYGTWVAEANASLKNTTQRSFVGQQSLLLTHTGSTGTTATIASGIVGTRHPVDPDETYRASMWFHHDVAGREVHLGIEFFNASGVSLGTTYSSAQMSSRTNAMAAVPEWTAVSHAAVAPLSASTAVVKIELRSRTSDALDGFLWVDSIILCPYGEIISPTTRKAMLWIPEFMREEDLLQEGLAEPLARFIDLIGSQVNDINEMIDDFDYISVADGGDPSDTSTLVDPSGYPTSGVQREWLPWLSQLLGIGNVEVSGGYTPWYYLEQNYPTWADWEATINAAAPASSVALSDRSRTTGIATLTAAAAHGLQVGDVVTVTTAPATNFNGYYAITGVAGLNFSYSQQYTVLSAIRPASSTTVTIVCSRPHGLSAGDSVTIAGVGNVEIDGSPRTVVAVSQVGDDGGNNAFTITTASSTAFASYTGSVRPLDVTSTATTGTVVKASDLTWAYVEDANPYPLDPTVVSVDLISTGATGIWGGTTEGIKRAARVALTGANIPVRIQANAGVLTATTTEPHGFTAGAFIEIYRSPISKVNQTYVIASAPTSTTFTVAGAAGSFSTTGWATTKRVEVTKGTWRGRIATVVVASSVMTITFTTKVPVSTVPSNPTVIISGIGASPDGTYTPASATVSADRMSISFSVALGNLSITPPSSARAEFTTNRFCLVVKTLTSQTIDESQVLSIAGLAKPAGGVLSHGYI